MDKEAGNFTISMRQDWITDNLSCYPDIVIHQEYSRRLTSGFDQSISVDILIKKKGSPHSIHINLHGPMHFHGEYLDSRKPSNKLEREHTFARYVQMQNSA